MEGLLVIAQLVGAALGGAGLLKSGEYAINRYRNRKEGSLVEDPVTSEVCSIRHQGVDDKLSNISDDITEIKTTVNKLVELQLEVAKVGSKVDLAKEEIKSELKETTHEAMDKHLDKYHNIV